MQRYLLFLVLTLFPIKVYTFGMNLSDQLTKALQYHQNGDIENALVSYLEIVPTLPKSAGQVLSKVHSNIGAVYMQKGEYEQAKQHFQYAVESQPDDSSAMMNLAIVLTSKLNDHKKALRYALKVVQLNAENPKGYHLLGNILQSMGRQDEAVKYFVMAEEVAQNELRSTEKFSGVLVPSLVDVAVNDSVQVDIGDVSYTMQCMSKRPLLFHVERLLSDAECDHIQLRSRDKLEKSFIMGGHVVSTDEQSEGGDRSQRDSYNAWLPIDDVLGGLKKRIAALTGIPLAYIQQKSEELQVVKYTSSGFFSTHHDSSAFHPRLFTALIYLNSLSAEEGGETWFPYASRSNITTAEQTQFESIDDAIAGALELDPHLTGIAIRPSRGDAIIFFNHDVTDGSLDIAAVHSGRKVAGDATEKWIANYWVECDADFLLKLNG